MFWKNANARISRWRYSISARLTLLYTITSFLAATVFTGILYGLLAANFHTEHLDFLRSKAQEFNEDFRDGGDRPQALLAEIAKETSADSPSQYRARVLGPGGGVLGESANMNRNLPVSAFPGAVAQDAMDKHLVRDRYTGGEHFILTTFRLRPPGAAGPAYDVQLALDVTRDDDLLTDYRHGLLLFLALLVPVLIIAGHLVTRHGLRPLERISRAAQSVTPERLSGRIPRAPRWPPELEELVEVFNDMIERLEEAFTRLSQFSADLAHELRTPLNNLMGELEVCLSRERGVDDYRKTLVSNLEECRRLSRLIENLLFIARASEAEQPPRRVDFNARETCEGLLANHAIGAAERNVHLECDGDASVFADPILFRQAVSNLLANAIRHSNAGGTVRVTICAPAAGTTEVSVRDEGDGIATADLAHVFDRFYQADPSRSPRGQGTGLGLSIVQSIMDLHGGTVRLDSEPGAGTTACLSFPSDPRATTAQA